MVHGSEGMPEFVVARDLGRPAVAFTDRDARWPRPAMPCRRGPAGDREGCSTGLGAYSAAQQDRSVGAGLASCSKPGGVGGLRFAMDGCAYHPAPDGHVVVPVSLAGRAFSGRCTCLWRPMTFVSGRSRHPHLALRIPGSQRL